MRWLVLVGLLGCAPIITELPIDPATHELTRRSPASVEVLRDDPARPHVDVTLLYASDNRARRARLVGALRAHAADLGCDAIVLGDTTWRPPYGRHLHEPMRTGLYATCIAYTETIGNATASS